MDWFLNMFEITEDELMDIVLEHTVAHHVFDPTKVRYGPKLWDQDLWDKVR